MLTYFQGIVKYIKECPEDELAAYSLSQIIFDSNIKMATIDRLEKAKSEREAK